MLSVIVCHRNPILFNQFKESVSKTIGIPFEIVAIDNTKNTFNIFQAYNLGVKQSKYGILCFSHEDILFHTLNWGQKIVDHFTDPKIGIVGVAGGHYLPESPAAWFSSAYRSVNILHSTTKDGIKKINHTIEKEYFNDLSAEVVAVDGVWFCIPRILFQTISFDEHLFKGFHCYDLDISLQTRKLGLKAIVVSDILIEHFSGGNCDDEWIKNSIILNEKWRNCLPQIAGITLTCKEKKITETYLKEKFQLLVELISARSKLNHLGKSKAYRFGKKILKPFIIVKKLLSLR